MAGVYTHTNRRGVTYYLCAAKTKRCATRYYLSDREDR